MEFEPPYIYKGEQKMILSKGLVNANAVPLTSADGKTFCIERIAGPDQRRLCELGFIEGARIEVVNRARPDMLVVKVGGARMALARGIADSVWVQSAS